MSGDDPIGSHGRPRPREPRLLGRGRQELGGARPDPLGRRRDHVGHLGRARIRAGSAAGCARAGRRRARLWHGLRVVVARAPRRPSGGVGQLGEAARNGADLPGGVRDPFPAGPRRRRAGAVPRRELRPGDLGVRRGDLVRSLPVDPGGGEDPSPRGQARVLGSFLRRDADVPDEDLPASEQLQRDHFGMHRFEWPEATEGAAMPTDPLATPEWARRWPIEEAWKARKTR